MNKRVVSGLRPAVLLIWTAFFLIIPVYVLHEDLTSDGLKRTQAYLLVGNLIYPLFYGATLFGLYRIASMYLRRRDFVTIGDGVVGFGGKSIPLTDVREVDVCNNWLGISQLTLFRNEGADYRFAGYVLSRRVGEVAAEIKAALPTQTPR